MQNGTYDFVVQRNREQMRFTGVALSLFVSIGKHIITSF